MLPNTALSEIAAALELCDPNLRAVTQTPNGYRLRGDRCEGLFIQEIAGSSLRIVSFTGWYQEFDPLTMTEIVLTWKAPTGSGVNLRATGLQRRLYYRMDTVIPIGNSSYHWPTEVLNSLGLKKNHLGLLGWTTYNLAGIKRQVYLPVNIASRPLSDPKTSYELIIIPGVELEEVYISLALVKSMPYHLTYITEGKPLGYYYYPPERPIKIPISNPKSPGIYYLQIGAILRKGGSTNCSILFYHPND